MFWGFAASVGKFLFAFFVALEGFRVGYRVPRSYMRTFFDLF